MMITKRSAIHPMPEYFDRYINLVDDVELLEAFDRSIAAIDALDLDLLDSIAHSAYEPGKWTVNGVIQHIADFERILSYRALVYARKAGIVPQSIDENLVAENANTGHRTAREVVADLRAARVATRELFASFDQEMLDTIGLCWKYEMQVLAMGFNIIGHQVHHFKVLEERYYPLAEKSMSVPPAVAGG
jgi:hypothetical protein